jgi:hypothetical protein
MFCVRELVLQVSFLKVFVSILDRVILHSQCNFLWFLSFTSDSCKNITVKKPLQILLHSFCISNLSISKHRRSEVVKITAFYVEKSWLHTGCTAANLTVNVKKFPSVSKKLLWKYLKTCQFASFHKLCNIDLNNYSYRYSIKFLLVLESFNTTTNSSATTTLQR